MTELFKYITALITLITVGSEILYLLYVSFKLHKDNIHTTVYEDKIVITLLTIGMMFILKACFILLVPKRFLIQLINICIVIGFSWLMTVYGMQLLDKRKKIKDENK